ncbi:YciI family protein [Spirillospora sp. CA-253888]
MPRFILLTNHAGSAGAGPMSEWDPDDITAHLAYLRALNERLVDSGELVDMQALTGPDLAEVVTSGGPAGTTVTDGPYAAAGEVLAGYRMVDVACGERAIEIAAEVSAAPGPGGVPLRRPVEVRQVMGLPPGGQDL